METVQIYSIVEELAKQSMGSEDISVVDTNSFISTGLQILSSNNYTENFTNNLILRIARTIISFRRYNSKLRPLVFDDLRWGAIVQKVKTEMPEAVEDEAYDLVDGDSVDMYTVRKPKFHQKFFVNRTPYSFYVTIQRWQLKRAFTSESAFGELVASIFGEVQNKLEITFENLGYSAMANFMGNTPAVQQVNLLTEYNNATGQAIANPKQAERDSEFVRWAVAEMNIIADRLTDMNTVYNKEGYSRHTPKEYQRFVILSNFEQHLKTVVQWMAFHEQYVKLDATMTVPRWQSLQSPYSIAVTDETGKNKEIDNIVAFIFDRDALGTYRKEQEVLTTPVNARGRYTNTFWHEEQMWFNDLSEQGVVFTLN